MSRKLCSTCGTTTTGTFCYHLGRFEEIPATSLGGTGEMNEEYTNVVRYISTYRNDRCKSMCGLCTNATQTDSPGTT